MKTRTAKQNKKWERARPPDLMILSENENPHQKKTRRENEGGWEQRSFHRRRKSRRRQGRCRAQGRRGGTGLSAWDASSTHPSSWRTPQWVPVVWPLTIVDHSQSQIKSSAKVLDDADVDSHQPCDSVFLDLLKTEWVNGLFDLKLHLKFGLIYCGPQTVKLK